MNSTDRDRSPDSSISDEEYVEYVKARAATQNYRAEEKLKDIDDLSDMIFLARQKYRGSKAKES